MSFVYFIQCENDGPIKVGYSTSPKQRFAFLDNGSPFKLHFLGAISGTRGDERGIQNALINHHHKGEWFKASAKPEIEAIIAQKKIPDSMRGDNFTPKLVMVGNCRSRKSELDAIHIEVFP